MHVIFHRVADYMDNWFDIGVTFLVVNRRREPSDFISSEGFYVCVEGMTLGAFFERENNTKHWSWTLIGGPLDEEITQEDLKELL